MTLDEFSNYIYIYIYIYVCVCVCVVCVRARVSVHVSAVVMESSMDYIVLYLLMVPKFSLKRCSIGFINASQVKIQF